MRHRLIRFLVSGGSAAAVEFTVFVALHALLGNPWLIASQSISFGCGFACSFLLNRHWVFRSGGAAWQELLRYALIAGINLVVGNAILLLLTGPLELNGYVAKFLVMAGIAVWNYLVFSRLVFKNTSGNT